MDLVKLLEAIAWPITVIFVALVALLMTRMILNKNGRIGIHWKEWFSFEADASGHLSQTAAGSESLEGSPNVASVATNEPALVESSEIMPSQEVIEHANADQPSSPNIHFFSATTLAELETTFEDFKRSELDLDLDFWTTFYVERRQLLGAEGTVEELQQLAEANPTWITPITSLLRLAVRSHDVDRSLELISQALARRNSTNSKNVLTAVVSAYHKLYSIERALRFFREECSRGASSADRATMLAALSTSLSADKFSASVATEMAQVSDPGRRANGFQLAYSYSEDPKLWALSYNAYSEIDHKSFDYTWSLNNRGVLIQNIDKQLAIDFYEKGLMAENAQSASNLARLLIDDGYVGVGERLLDAIEDHQEAGEHIASTRAAALAARRGMQKRLSELQALTMGEAQKYRAVIARALKMMERPAGPPSGIYASTDHSLAVMLDGGGVTCRFVVGTLNFIGALPASPFGYDGTLQEERGGLLASRTPISILVTGPEALTAIIWPVIKSDAHTIRIIDLDLAEAGRSVGISHSGSKLLSSTGKSAP